MQENVSSTTTEKMELDRIEHICEAAKMMEAAATMLDAAEAVEDNRGALERVVIDRVDLKATPTPYLEHIATVTDAAVHAKEKQVAYLRHVAEVLAAFDAERLPAHVETVGAVADDAAEDAGLYRAWVMEVRAELASRAKA